VPAERTACCGITVVLDNLFVVLVVLVDFGVHNGSCWCMGKRSWYGLRGIAQAHPPHSSAQRLCEWLPSQPVLVRTALSAQNRSQSGLHLVPGR
jgi:hypothetical protein